MFFDSVFFSFLKEFHRLSICSTFSSVVSLVADFKGQRHKLLAVPIREISNLLRLDRNPSFFQKAVFSWIQSFWEDRRVFCSCLNGISPSPVPKEVDVVDSPTLMINLDDCETLEQDPGGSPLLPFFDIMESSPVLASSLDETETPPESVGLLKLPGAGGLVA